MKYTPKQLRALKKKFTPLPYADKLKFWDEYFSELHGFYNYFYTTIYFDDVADTERMKPENFISLYPKDKQEKEQFNRWVLNSIQRNPHYNFENLKENYFDKITNNPRPIEYTEQEIKGIEKQRDKEKKYMDEGRDIPSWGYYYGYQSVVQSIDVTKEIEADTLQRIGLSFAKGIVDAHYLGFLEKQLEQIKQGKEILSLPKESNTEIYHLTSMDIEAMKENPNYLVLSNLIGIDKGLNILNEQKEIIAKIFVPELAYILTEKKVQYTEPTNGKLNLRETTITKANKYFDGKHFLNTYIEAYSKGERDFEKDFGIDTNTLYGANAKYYVDTIHYHYFHVDLKANFGEGWNHWRKTFPGVINIGEISEYGYYAAFISKVWELASKHPQLFKGLDKCDLKEHQNEELEQADTSEPQLPPEMKPTFKPEAVNQIFDLLKGFFSAKHQSQLEQILKTGDNSTEHLIFKDNGNRLADAFKQLKERDFITGCEKKQLEIWIAQNFKFISRGETKLFTPDYIEKCISRNYYPCKKPLFSIEKGVIIGNT